MNALTDLDLCKLIDQYGIKNFNGVFSKDQIPKQLKEGYYIINLQNHDSGNGTHWTCFLVTNNGLNIYFDSFNSVAPENIDLAIRPYVYNDRQIQDLTSSACGWYCIAAIRYIATHSIPNIVSEATALHDFINGFSNNTQFNDGILQRYL